MSQDVFDGLVPFNGTDGLAPRYMVEEAALHEAGHAVAAVVLFPAGSIASASLLSLLDLESRLNGRVRIYSPPVAEVGLRGLGAFSYAGIAASCGQFDLMLPELDVSPPLYPKVFCEDYSGFWDLWEGSSHDRVTLEAAAARLFGAHVPQDQWQQDYWRAALDLIAAHAGAVEAVARELFSHGHLSGQRIEGLLGVASGSH